MDGFKFIEKEVFLEGMFRVVVGFEVIIDYIVDVLELFEVMNFELLEKVKFYDILRNEGEFMEIFVFFFNYSVVLL